MAALYLFGIFGLFCIGAACLESWLDWKTRRRVDRIMQRLGVPPRSDHEPWTAGRKHSKGGL